MTTSWKGLPSKVMHVALSAIRMDEEAEASQLRVGGVDRQRVAELVEVLSGWLADCQAATAAGEPTPPWPIMGTPIRAVTWPGAEMMWPGDGWHRISAATEAKLEQLPVEVYTATTEEAAQVAALEMGCGANGQHGAGRTRDDTAAQIARMLTDDRLCRDAGGKLRSYRAIGDVVGVAHKTVRRYEEALVQEGALTQGRLDERAGLEGQRGGGGTHGGQAAATDVDTDPWRGARRIEDRITTLEQFSTVEQVQAAAAVKGVQERVVGALDLQGRGLDRILKASWDEVEKRECFGWRGFSRLTKGERVALLGRLEVLAAEAPSELASALEARPPARQRRAIEKMRDLEQLREALHTPALDRAARSLALEAFYAFAKIPKPGDGDWNWHQRDRAALPTPGLRKVWDERAAIRKSKQDKESAAEVWLKATLKRTGADYAAALTAQGDKKWIQKLWKAEHETGYYSLLSKAERAQRGAERAAVRAEMGVRGFLLGRCPQPSCQDQDGWGLISKKGVQGPCAVCGRRAADIVSSMRAQEEHQRKKLASVTLADARFTLTRALLDPESPTVGRDEQLALIAQVVDVNALREAWAYEQRQDTPRAYLLDALLARQVALSTPAAAPSPAPAPPAAPATPPTIQVTRKPPAALADLSDLGMIPLLGVRDRVWYRLDEAQRLALLQAGIAQLGVEERADIVEHVEQLRETAAPDPDAPIHACNRCGRTGLRLRGAALETHALTDGSACPGTRPMVRAS